MKDSNIYDDSKDICIELDRIKGQLSIQDSYWLSGASMHILGMYDAYKEGEKEVDFLNNRVESLESKSNE